MKTSPWIPLTFVFASFVLAGAASLAACSGDDTTGADADADVPLGLTCSKLLFCDQSCSSNDCTDACYSQATGVAQGLFNQFTACVSAQCPNGDSTCEQNAGTGACGGQLSQCFSDTFLGPPDSDGGAVVVPEAGATYNCGALNICLSSCASDAGTACAGDCNAKATPQAEALYAALTSCLAVACPSTAGGPCETPGPACAGCIEQVTLADPNTCAAPYVACNADTSNSDGGVATPTALVDGGALQTILTGLDQAASTIVVNGGWLYFTQVIEGGPVYRLWIGDGPGAFPASGIPFGDGGASRPDGGALLESVGPPQPTPVSLAVDANNVYVWSVGTFDLNASVNKKDGTVVQIPLGGGPPVTIATGVEAFYDSGYLNAVAVDSTYVYWVSGASGTDGAILRAPIGGGPVVTLYSGQALPEALATDGTHVFWANWGTFDAQGRSNDDGSVWQGSVDGGTAVELASGQNGPSTIVFDATNVYWLDLGPLGTANFPALNSGTVLRAPIGGGPVTTMASAQSVPFSSAVANGILYWTDYGLSGPGLVMSAPTGGGITVPLASGLDDPSALVVTGKTIYWTNANSSPNNGSISALTLP